MKIHSVVILFALFFSFERMTFAVGEQSFADGMLHYNRGKWPQAFTAFQLAQWKTKFNARRKAIEIRRAAAIEAAMKKVWEENETETNEVNQWNNLTRIPEILSEFCKKDCPEDLAQTTKFLSEFT